MHFLSPPPQQSSWSSRNLVQAPFWAGNEADSKKRGLEAKSWKQKAHCLAPRITDPTSFSPLPTILAFSSDSLKKRETICVCRRCSPENSLPISSRLHLRFFPSVPMQKVLAGARLVAEKQINPRLGLSGHKRINAFDLRFCFSKYLNYFHEMSSI